MPETATLDIQPLIPVGLNQLAIQVAGNWKQRAWLFTDPSTTTVTLTSGVADLSTLITTPGILIDFLRYGNIYLNAVTGQPLAWQNQVGTVRMAGPYDAIFSHIAQQGNSLIVRGPNATPPSGTLYLAVNYVPSLSDLPSALDDDLVNTIAQLIVHPAENKDAA